MATAFIGLSVIVRLRSPQNVVLRGLVTDVRDQRLYLDNVFDLSNQWHVGKASFLGAEIDDIEVAPTAAAAATAPPVPPAKPPLPQQQTKVQPPPSNIADPAIVSYTRTPVNNGPPALPVAVKQSVPPQIPPPPAAPPLDVSATLTTPFNHHAVNSNADPALQPRANGADVSVDGAAQNGSGKQKKKKKTARVQAASTDMTRQQSNGWRQTPILVEPPPTRKQQHQQTSKQSRRQLQQLHFEEQYGEASDYQDLPDFDFASNNAKFDKQAAFDQIRNEDTTADEDRLVSHNRLPRPGTFGGSKLHPTEPVIDRPVATNNDGLHSDSDNEVVALDASMASHKLRAVAKPVPKRRDNALTREALTNVPRSSSQGRFASSLGRANSSKAGDLSSPSLSASRTRKPSLRYSSTNQICLAIPPSIIQAAELQATSKSTPDESTHDGGYSLTPDILAENAARSIAEIALSAINVGGRRGVKGNLNPDPVVVILAGECEAGARAIAAGRHMSERRVRVVVTFPDVGERVVLRQAHVQRQLDRFRGKQMEWDELRSYLKTLDAPPELIIDGLFGADKKFSALNEDDRTVALQMMSWANKSKASVLAIDIPSGIDPDSGNVKVFEGEPAEIRAKIVVACGAPSSGLLKAVQAKHAEGYGESWKMFVSDVGITTALQQAVKKKYRASIGFGQAWTVPIHFDKGTPADS